MKIEIIKRQIPKIAEKRYSVPTVAQAIGLSEGTISAYFSSKKISTKNGITLDQITEVIDRERTRNKKSGINWFDVTDIIDRLDKEKGYKIIRYDCSDEDGDLISNIGG